MNRDDIKKWSNANGLGYRHDLHYMYEDLYRSAYNAGAAAEREACAKVCDEMRTYVGRNNAVTQSSAQDCAAAIRARGQA